MEGTELLRWRAGVCFLDACLRPLEELPTEPASLLVRERGPEEPRGGASSPTLSRRAGCCPCL